MYLWVALFVVLSLVLGGVACWRVCVVLAREDEREKEFQRRDSGSAGFVVLAVGSLAACALPELARANQTVVCPDSAFLHYEMANGGCEAQRSLQSFANVQASDLVLICAGGTAQGNCSASGGTVMWEYFSAIGDQLVYDYTADSYLYPSNISDLNPPDDGGGDPDPGDSGNGASVLLPALSAADGLAIAGATLGLWGLAWAGRLLMINLRKGID